MAPHRSRSSRARDGRHRFETRPDRAGLGGGSLPILYDADRDGDEDIVSGQYFDRSASFVWFERVAPPSPPGPLRRLGPARDGRRARAASSRWPSSPASVWSAPTTPTRPRARRGRPSPGSTCCALESDPRLPWRTRLLSEGIVSRSDTALGQQQGAPGVIGHGDVDGDRDLDLVVSGDGDPTVAVARTHRTSPLRDPGRGRRLRSGRRAQRSSTATVTAPPRCSSPATTTARSTCSASAADAGRQRGDQGGRKRPRPAVDQVGALADQPVDGLRRVAASRT